MAVVKENIHTSIISQVGQYIFDHSDRAITLDELANYTGFSKYHFNRLFFAATGYQLGEFIQRRKLEKAMHIIKQGEHNILDVALSVGYDSASSFTRAFKKVFAITPSDAVKGNFPSNERAGQLAPKKILTELNFKPKLLELDEQKIYGLYDKGFSEQSFSAVAGNLYGQLAAMAAPLDFSELKPVGVSIDNPWVGEQTESQFFAGFSKGLTEHENTLDVFTWQAGLWGCFLYVGPHNVMWQTISQIYAQWVIPNNIRLKDQQIVQLYLNNPQNTPADELRTELYFAVEA